MAGVAESEGTFQAGDVSLYTKTWTPLDPITAKLVFVHGFSDHINRYAEFFHSLAARGIVVYGFDQRGWGRSVRKPSDRGLSGPTSRVVADIVLFVTDRLRAEPASAPLFVMGHSMGGAEVLTLMSDPAHADVVGKVRGWLLESPFIDFDPSEAPSWLKVHVGRLVGRLLPHRQLYNPLPPEAFSRDPEVVRSIIADELCHDTGTLEGLAGLLDRSERLRSGKAKLLTSGAAAAAAAGEVATKTNGVQSVILMHGTADRSAAYAAAKTWWDAFAAGNVPDGEFRGFEGAYHQLHADLCKSEFFQVTGDWILARLDERGRTRHVAGDEAQDAAQEAEAAGETEESGSAAAKL